MNLLLALHLLSVLMFWFIYIIASYATGDKHKTSFKMRVYRMAWIYFARKNGFMGNVPDVVLCAEPLNNHPLLWIEVHENGKPDGIINTYGPLVLLEFILTIFIPFGFIFILVYSFFGYALMEKLDKAGFIFIESRNVPGYASKGLLHPHYLTFDATNYQLFLAPGMTEDEAVEKMKEILPVPRRGKADQYGLV